jgi:uncharacterized protein YdeI (YjbR/CyaY-like superfamily)
MTQDFSKLKRPVQKMPDWVGAALDQSSLRPKYEARPPYQQNDYLSWITRAKRPATQQKRLQQMLDELKQGDVYMKMDWPPGRA